MTDFRTLTKREKVTILKRNRGMLTRAAGRCGVSLGQVSRVWWLKSAGSDVVIDAINEILSELLSTRTDISDLSGGR